MSQLRFDDRVAIVTGAGGGLGKAHALLLAARGAKVLVNDLGGSITGDGSSSRAADAVVEEIRAGGGEAVANYDSVSDGASIVRAAVEAFGRIDIVINNAGILRDVSFHKMTQEDWDKVYEVHVQGAFRVTHAAWPLMREQGYGRVIMTASAAGLYGNFGQTNYAMAKLGLAGFALALATEGRRKNILVNTIAPIAGSRMTETILPAPLVAALRPEYVSPLVARLCHESSQETGAIFEVGGGFFSKLRWERSAGKMVRAGRSPSIEDVDQAWSDITSFAHATHPDSVAASLQPIMENVAAGPSKGGSELIDVDAALGYSYPEVQSSYDEKSVALYALGVGAGSRPTDDQELQLVYERHESGMKVLPSFAVIPALNAMLQLAVEGKQAPGLHYGLDRVLHGEQYTELMRPLPTSQTLSHRARIKDIFDKGEHALVVTEILSYDGEGRTLMRNEVTALVRGGGGWGGDRGPSREGTIPERAPDEVREELIPLQQGLLYRLSGDWNPLHADPGFAKAFGFDRPILHGLCTFGYATRHVLEAMAPNGDADYFKSIRARFAASVFPGETLRTEMWRESPQRVVFQCKVVERDVVVLSDAAVELHQEVPTLGGIAEAGQAAEAPSSADVFVAIRDHIERHPALVERVRTVFRFQLRDPDSTWTIDLKNSAGSVSQGEAASADCTLALAEADFLAMVSGKADAIKLYSSGKLRISGDVAAAQKLAFLQQIDLRAARAAVAKARAENAGVAGDQ